MKKHRLAVAVAIVLGAPASSFAQEAASMFKFSGFGTLGAVSTDTNDAAYSTSVLQPPGAKKSADFGVDSLIAGQVDARFTPAFSATIQAVANRTADDDYTPHIEWAFARYAFTPELSVRGGIMAVPVFMLSDSRLVGFTYPWVRPPTALYSQAPFTNFQGADLMWRPESNGIAFTVQPFLGIARPQVPSGDGHATVDLDNLVGLNVAGEMGGWTVRGSYMKMRFTYRDPQVQSLMDGLRQIDGLIPGAAALADELDTIDKPLSFASVGVGYERGNVLFQAEYGKRKADTFLSDTSAWYATFGYRFGNFMPHVTYSQVRVDSPTSQSVVPPVGPLAPLAGGVNALLEGQNTAQRTFALGARYQFHKNADLKVQWDRIDLPSGAIGNFQDTQPTFPGSKVNVYSVSVDFVF